MPPLPAQVRRGRGAALLYLPTPHPRTRGCRDDYVEVMRSLKASVDADIAAFLCHVPLLACCTAAELLALAQVRSIMGGGQGTQVQ